MMINDLDRGHFKGGSLVEKGGVANCDVNGTRLR